MTTPDYRKAVDWALQGDSARREAVIRAVVARSPEDSMAGFHILRAAGILGISDRSLGRICAPYLSLPDIKTEQLRHAVFLDKNPRPFKAEMLERLKGAVLFIWNQDEPKPVLPNDPLNRAVLIGLRTSAFATAEMILRKFPPEDQATFQKQILRVEHVYEQVFLTNDYSSLPSLMQDLRALSSRKEPWVRVLAVEVTADIGGNMIDDGIRSPELKQLRELLERASTDANHEVASAAARGFDVSSPE